MGLLDGPMKTFYKSGSIREECTYKRGKLHGDHKSYYEDGSLDTVAYFNEGKLDGDYRAYFQNGMPKKEAHSEMEKRKEAVLHITRQGKYSVLTFTLEGRVIQRKNFG